VVVLRLVADPDGTDEVEPSGISAESPLVVPYLPVLTADTGFADASLCYVAALTLSIV